MEEKISSKMMLSNACMSFVSAVLVVDVVGAAFAFFLPDCRGVRSSFAVDDDEELLAAAKKEENSYYCKRKVNELFVVIIPYVAD